MGRLSISRQIRCFVTVCGAAWMAATGLAQTAAGMREPIDGKAVAQESKADNFKRITSVTWDLATRKLIFVVEKGTLVDGAFVPSASVKYQVSPDDAYMALGDEKRSFGAEEAANLHLLLGVLSRYCVESVVWWDLGDAPTTAPAPGPATKPEQPAQPKPPIAPAGKPVKVAQPKSQQPAILKHAELVTAKEQ